MKNTISLILILFISCLSIKAQPEHIFAGQTIHNIVDNLSSRIETILNQLDDIFNRNAFDLRQHLTISIDHLDYILRENINLTFDNLNSQQRNAIININNVLIEAEKSGIKFTKELETLVDKSIALVGSLPLSKKKPIITKVTPSYAIFDSNDIELTINGSWLAKGKSYINLDSIIVLPHHKVDNLLKFRIPINSLAYSEKPKLIRLPLEIRRKRKYEIGMTLIPKELGNYKLEVNYKLNKRVTKVRSQNFSASNGHCAGDRNVNWSFNAQSGGWKIDPSSVKIVAIKTSTKSRFDGIRSLSDRAFQLSGRVGNNGSCIKVFGKHVARDGRGVINGKVIWKEYKDEVAVTGYEVFNSGPIYWGEDIDFELPDNTSSIKITVNKFNGKKSISTTVDGVIKNDEWFTTEYVKEGNSYIIKPRNLEDVLR